MPWPLSTRVCCAALQAICIAACYPEDWPLLVICPSALRLQWADALLSWAPPALLPPPEHIAVVAAAKVGASFTPASFQYPKFYPDLTPMSWAPPALLPLPKHIAMVTASKVGLLI